VRGETKVEVDDGFAYGAVIGIDVPIEGGHWAVSGSLRYLVSSIDMQDADVGGEVDINPFEIRAGFAYRF
jgi:outer membrane protein W